MEKIRLGRTGMMVSNLGFGGIPIQRLTENEAIDVVQRALDLGVNFIDTANGYTTSEERIGKAIRGRREGLFLATKTLDRTGDGVKEHLKLSLQRFGVDYIDLYQFHNVNNDATLTAILAPDGPMSVLEEAKKAGIIRHIGVSSHGHQTALAAAKLDCFETMMYPYNFVAHEPGEEVLAACQANNIDFFAMKPTGGGRLDNATLAFKFLLNVPGVVPFVGIEKPEEIEEIVEIEKNLTPLTKAEQDEIKRIVDEIGDRFCRRCRYCLPCPEGIIIPLLNNLVTFLRHDSAEQCFGDGIVAKTVDKARSCTECGECEERCPYDLPIIEMNRDNVKLYDEAKAKYERGLK